MSTLLKIASITTLAIGVQLSGFQIASASTAEPSIFTDKVILSQTSDPPDKGGPKGGQEDGGTRLMSGEN